MPNFEVKVVSGSTLASWSDPVSSMGAPSRVRPHPGILQRFHKITRGTPVILHAIVDGVEAPLDAALGGRLFAACMVEAPLPGPPATLGVAGQSSVQQFTPIAAGHHTVRLTRKDGGGVILHFDAQ